MTYFLHFFLTIPGILADVEVGVGESLVQLSAWQQLDNSIFIIYGEIDDMELGDNLFVACCRCVSGYFGNRGQLWGLL